MGAADALESIWVSLFFTAYVLLYDSKNTATDKLIQIAYQIELAIANDNNIMKLSSHVEKNAININDIPEIANQRLAIL